MSDILRCDRISTLSFHSIFNIMLKKVPKKVPSANRTQASGAVRRKIPARFFEMKDATELLNCVLIDVFIYTVLYRIV